MKNQPDFIDNIDGNSLSSALREILNTEKNETSVISEISDSVNEARIATAYFSPEGFSRIAAAIKNIPSIKLMLGSDPIADHERWQRNIDESEQRFLGRKFRQNLKQQEEALRSERNHIPFTKDSRSALRQLVSLLRAGNMEVRRYEESFLHAKAYIFTSPTILNERFIVPGCSVMPAL